MALNDILSSATSGLAAAQAGLRAVANNIANVGVPGYAREKVPLSTAVNSGRINGVKIGEPERVADQFLEAAVYRRAGVYGRTEVTSGYLDRLQSLLGQPGSKTGLPGRLDAISAAATAMTGSQSSAQTGAVFTGAVRDALASMQQMTKDVNGLRADVESETGSSVDKINTLLKRIYDLNTAMAQSTGLGRSASGTADQRMNAIEELGSLISVNVRNQPDGRVTIETASGAMLLDGRLRQLDYTANKSDTSQASYPDINIRFANADGSPGALTGEKIDSAAAGGKLGGLLDLRDRALPSFSEQMGVVFSGLAQALNAASNEGTTVPPPASLTGRQSGMIGQDRLGFTGSATFAITKADGTMVAKTTIDFDALGPNATINDMVQAINTGLGSAGSASFTNGVLSFSATDSGNGVVIAQAPAPGKPSSRAGMGVAQFFGMNDLVRSDSSTLVPSGFKDSDPHGFGAGQTAQIVLRDASGLALTSYTLKPTPGGTMGDLVNDLNSSPLGSFGKFKLDDHGRMRFEPASGLSGAVISIPTDNSDRYGTGRSFSALMGLSGFNSGLMDAKVRSDIATDATKLPLARLDVNAAINAKALGAGDTRGATAFVDKLAGRVDLGKDGIVSIGSFSSQLLGRAGLEASQAKSNLDDAGARKNDAVNRRDSYSGVNIDEELSQMVVLQNSYSAAARVMSTASQMYDTLLQMLK